MTAEAHRTAALLSALALGPTALATAAYPAGAQTSPLYLTAYDARLNYPNPGPFYAPIYVVQGGAVTRVMPTTPGTIAYDLVVDETIHTMGYEPGRLGQEYTLTGTAIGTPYDRAPITPQPPGWPPPCCFYDGANDGRYSYTVPWRPAYELNMVYRGNLDWTGLTPLFPLAVMSMGIAYDPTNNGLWVASFAWPRPAVYLYSLTGTILSSFSIAGIPNATGVTGLAFDPADNTLWLTMGGADPGMLYQFSRDGTLLDAVRVLGGPGQPPPVELMGAEFQYPGSLATAVPEPSIEWLTATGLVVVGLTTRRRRRLAPRHRPGA
ncbi:PEP-CTERM sorting domain-containing protein [Gemmatirosa kalamazoonensis]|uniref:PEP-CTERM sorting domain-containing protein n=1 Tax=Gemmatirosa kalamazoonensis TaxID=861299 RepID=UPI00046D128D|nr:PEP-CTERM sorting domain-containing protein [Gemmatirosa kalamazoonensis]